MDHFKIVISDCHLSAGRVFEGRLNPHEDFGFDSEMCELFEYFSTGAYGSGPHGPVQVELFINGDYLDFLNVPLQGEFEDAITETVAVQKVEAILAGHPAVMKALKKFASQPGKTITYMIGNHDADLFFPKVRERIIKEWDPEGCFPSEKVKIIADRDRVRFEGGVEVHHGNQFEAVHVLNFEQPLLSSFLDEPVLNLPWGSFYVLKIINRLKPEREFIDKVRPMKLFVVYGLLFDTLFTLRFCFLSLFYFLKTRFIYNPRRKSSLKVTAKILKQETNFLLDLEREARQLLDSEKEIQTVIFGHTHKPMNKVYPDGKQYINTGTWTKMINLDLRNIGQQFCLTFAFVRISDGKANCELRQWMGETIPHKNFRG
ncbi:MAG: metallophosphoesterase [Bdellovibrio sp.]|nr:metallophosphoesterase [Bdellovibrio sp.]